MNEKLKLKLKFKLRKRISFIKIKKKRNEKFGMVPIVACLWLTHDL